MGEKRKIDVSIKSGMENEGDPALAEAGVCELLTNVEYIDDGLYGRQAFPCDYLVPAETPLGLFVWDDRTNEIVRMGAITDTGGEASGKLLIKDASGGETWAAVGSVGNVDAFVVSSFANYRGIVYFCLGDAETPPTTFSYDGVTLRRGTGIHGITARLVCVFGERVFYGNLLEIVVNELTTDPLGAAFPYNPTLWTLTNVAVTKASVTVSGRTATIYQISPTATTGAMIELPGAFEVSNSADETKFQMLVMLAGVDGTYRMPMTISAVFRGLPWEASTGYVLGTRRHPVTANGFIYICTQAGTSGGSEPAWPEPTRVDHLTITVGGTGYATAPTVTLAAPPAGGIQATATATVAAGVVTSLTVTNPGRGYLVAPAVTFSGGGGSGAAASSTLMSPIGVEVTDGTVKWKCESVDVIASERIEVPSTADSLDPISIYIGVQIPPVVGSYIVMLRYAFGTASQPTVRLVPISFSMDDGQPEGTSVQLRKNFAQQLTVGSFQYPFVASSPGTLALVDEGVWSEPGQPDLILAENSVLLIEELGALTGLKVAGSRLWWFKRRATWAFLLQKDPNFPILREKVYVGVGSLGPKAADALKDRLFTIGEHQVFAFDANEAPIQVMELCPEGIRRLIMGRGSEWVENLPASSGQTFMPILRVHPVRKQVWVYTQDRKIFIYDIDGKRWTYFEIPKTGGFARIRDIEWNPTTNRMMVITENGIGRHAHREEQGSVAAIAVTAAGTAYATPPTVAIGAPPTGGVQATATATVAAGLVTAVTVTNPGSGYLEAPAVTFSGGGGTGAAASSRLIVRDSDASGNAFAVTKTIQPRPFEVRPQRAVMTVEDLALYGKIPMSQVNSTCEVDISFDGGKSFTFFNKVRLSPLSDKKRRYPIPVRKTGESVVVSLAHTGDTGNDVFNVLDIDANVIVRGEEQPKARPTPVSKNL